MLERLSTLKQELAWASAQYGNTKSLELTGMPGGGGGFKGTSDTEVLVFRKVELEEKIRKKETEIAEDWANLAPYIESLKPIETLVINLRYCYGGEWGDICRSLYGKRSDYEYEIDRYMNKLFKIHGSALRTLAQINKRG